MAKMRVHELANEINKNNKDVLDVLQANGVNVQTAFSTVDEAQADMVRKAFSPKPAEPKPEEKKEEKTEEVVQKKRITAVFRSQNSSQAKNRNGARPKQAGVRKPGQPGQKNPAQMNGKPVRPAGAKPVVKTTHTDAAAKPTVSAAQAAATQAAPAKAVQTTAPVQAASAKALQTAAPQTPAAQTSPAKAPQTSAPQTEAVPAKTAQAAAEQTVPAKTVQAAAEQTVPAKTVENAAQAAPVKTAAPQTPAVQTAPGENVPAKTQAAPARNNAGRTSNGEGRYQNNRNGENRQRNYDGNRRPQGDRNNSERPSYNRDNRDGQNQRRNSSEGRPVRDNNGRSFDRNGNGDNRQRNFDGNRRPQNDRIGEGRPQYNHNDRPQGERGGYNKDNDRPQFGGKDGQNRRPGQRNDNNRRNSAFAAPQGTLDSTQKNTAKGKQKQINRQNNKYDKKQDDDFELKGGKHGKNNLKAPLKTPEKKPEPVVEEIKTITIPETLTIKELAEHMKKQPSELIKKLFLQGKVVTLNQEVDYETAEEIAMEYDILCEKEVKVNVIEEMLKDVEDPEETLVPRPPVVCVMGHVDHGKTSLLDAIRSTNVIAREAGGITQHIGASVVEINGQKITFLDTPGHEAFTAMRMRGAQATDIAILVVAADDGVMPQTIEAINHAKAAGVEVIVAVNKIDKPSANVDRVKQEMAEYNLVPEDWGGTTIFVPVSAHTKEGIEDLLEMILLTAEVKELKANPKRQARGLVIEARLDKGKGPVATILVQKGTLHVGDFVAAGPCHGKVRAMMDDKGRRVKEAGPSTPVEILGLNDVPAAGEIFVSPETEKDARTFAETFISEGREKLLDDTKAKLSLDDLFDQIKAGNVKELNIIVKADVQGSVEAVRSSLTKLSNEEVVVKVIHGGVGAINESDVTLASASNAIIIGFNVRPDVTAKSIAEREKVDVRLYKVIYQAIEDVERSMKGMLDPIYEEQVIGHAIVRQTFKASGVGMIAGSYVMDGKFVRNCKARISRAGEQLFDGNVASLKRFKDDVKEVAKGYECGLVFEGFNDLQEDDMVEAYMMVEVPR